MLILIQYHLTLNFNTDINSYHLSLNFNAGQSIS